MSRKVREHRRERKARLYIPGTCSDYIIRSGHPEAVDMDCTLAYDGSCEYCPLFVPPPHRSQGEPKSVTERSAIN